MNTLYKYAAQASFTAPQSWGPKKDLGQRLTSPTAADRIRGLDNIKANYVDRAKSVANSKAIQVGMQGRALQSRIRAAGVKTLAPAIFHMKPK